MMLIMRSINMQALTNDIKRKHPGVTVYGIGDEAHKLQVSGHNEDDTPGVRAEDQDADNIREHRALDVMIGPNFSKADGHALVNDLVTNEVNQRRLLYVIFDGWNWSRSRGWVRADNSHDPHRDHVHISGEADDDANGASWVLSGVSSGDDDMFCRHGDVSEKVRAMQLALIRTGVDLSPVGGADGQYGNGTAAGLASRVGGDGRMYGAREYDALMALAYKGAKGDPGTIAGMTFTATGTFA